MTNSEPAPKRDVTAVRDVGFLIVGTARSGTTLCQRLGAELDGVWIPRETHFWSHYLPLTARTPRRRLKPPRVRELVETMQHAGGQLALTPSEAEQVLARVANGCTAWELFTVIVDVLSPPDSTMLGEKTPNHSWRSAQLLSARPTLKVVAVVRDPRANFASALGVSWGQRDSQRFGWRWRFLHERLLADRDAFGRHRVMIVRYEDVVADPRAFQTSLAAFLDIPMSVSTLASDELFLPHETWKSRALEEPDTTRIDSWRHVLDARDASLIEQITGDVAARFAYEFDLTRRLPLDPEAMLAERALAVAVDAVGPDPESTPTS